MDAVNCEVKYICTRVIRDPESGPDCAQEIDCYSYSGCTNPRCCKEEKKCRNNFVWLYDSCNGPLYEVDDCSRYSSSGDCNIQRCLKVTTSPTYKKTYKSVRNGMCIDSTVIGAYCTTTSSEEDCGISTYCSFGCSEQAGISNCLPKATITSRPYLEESTRTINVFENDRVELSCLDSIDPDGNISKCEWGIGSDYYDWMKVTVNATLGSTTVKLKVCDTSGSCDYDYAIINAVKRSATDPQDPLSENMPPLACFEVSPSRGLPNMTEFNFDASCSSDPDTGDFITSYVWDFGDGPKTSGKKVTHTYSDNGLQYMVYTITLTVLDNGKDGTKQKMSGLAMKKVLVGKEVDTLRLTANPNNGFAPLVVLFVASTTDGKNIFTNYDWDFDDGITRSNGYELFHAYRRKGTYLARVIASSPLGYFAVGSAVVNVSEAKGITNLTVKDTHLYGVASISIKCTSSETVSIEFGTERNKIRLSGFPCNTTSNIGPLVEPGQYTVNAEIDGCDALECRRSASFYVSPELPEVKADEINPAAVLIALLMVFFIAKRSEHQTHG